MILAQAAEVMDRSHYANRPFVLHTASGIFVILLFSLALAGLIWYLRAARRGDEKAASNRLFLLVFGTLTFQVTHTVEHFAQVGYWVMHPASNPWLTPWANAAARGLTTVFSGEGQVTTGNEVLHLLGNLILFFTLIAMIHAFRTAHTARREWRATRWAMGFEATHVIEHIALTGTWLILHRPLGVSTLFGYSYLLPPPWAPAIRIFWHFGFNVLPTTFALLGARELFRAGILSWKSRDEEKAPSAAKPVTADNDSETAGSGSKKVLAPTPG